MAVIPMWKVDRDNSMHTSKSDADKHDQMLEIGELFAVAVKSAAPDISAAQAEAIGLYLSKNREAVAKLCKGARDALSEAEPVSVGAEVTPIRAAQ
jgi:dsDNA-binding SOS-regulon protein